MFEFLLWVLQNIVFAPHYLVVALTHPGDWLNWSNPEAVMRFIYYGASVEFFFVVFTTFLVITALGMAWKREILWWGVRILEGFANAVGRTAARGCESGANGYSQCESSSEDDHHDGPPFFQSVSGAGCATQPSRSRHCGTRRPR